VLLDSDANASLLGILTNDATVRNAALFGLSTNLNFASCTDHELARGRTPAFGDIGVLSSGVDDEILDELLSTRGLLRFARGRGLDLERIEDLWLEPHEEMAHAEVLEVFTTAIAAAVSVVAARCDADERDHGECGKHLRPSRFRMHISPCTSAGPSGDGTEKLRPPATEVKSFYLMGL